MPPPWTLVPPTLQTWSVVAMAAIAMALLSPEWCCLPAAPTRTTTRAVPNGYMRHLGTR